MIRTVYERHCGKAWLVKFPHLTHRWPTVVSVIDAWFTVSACREETNPDALQAGNRPLLATIFDPSVTLLS